MMENDRDDIPLSPISERGVTALPEVKRDEAPDYPKGLKLVVIILGLQFAVFCVALDNTIISTAIPRITDQFHALEDVGWYGSCEFVSGALFYNVS